MTSNLATIKLDEETGDHVLELPPELVAAVGWEIGDTLVWTPLEDGVFSLRKADHC